jgi:hypothetical protein
VPKKAKEIFEVSIVFQKGHDFSVMHLIEVEKIVRIQSCHTSKGTEFKKDISRDRAFY